MLIIIYILVFLVFLKKIYYIIFKNMDNNAELIFKKVPTNKDNDYLSELLRPRTYAENFNGFFPACYEVLSTYKLFELFTFPFMMGSAQYAFFHNVFGIYPYFFIVPMAFVLSIFALLNTKRKLFFAYLKYFTINKQNFPKVVLQPTTPELFTACIYEKKRIEAVIRPKYEQFFAAKEQGFTLIGSTCVNGMGLTKPIHDLGIYWNGVISEEFLKDMKELGYIEYGCSMFNNDPSSVRLIHKDSNSEWGYEIIICCQASYDWMYDSLTFCEYITNFKPERDQYEELKRKNIQANMIDYYENKKDEMLEIRAKSKDWKKNYVIEIQRQQQAMNQNNQNNQNNTSNNQSNTATNTTTNATDTLKNNTTATTNNNDTTTNTNSKVDSKSSSDKKND